MSWAFFTPSNSEVLGPTGKPTAAAANVQMATGAGTTAAAPTTTAGVTAVTLTAAAGGAAATSFTGDKGSLRHNGRPDYCLARPTPSAPLLDSHLGVKEVGKVGDEVGYGRVEAFIRSVVTVEERLAERY